MNEVESEWERFNRMALGKPSRELLRRAIGLGSLTGTATGVAVDLGAGSGADTLALLGKGWTVHAVDADAPSLRMLVEQAPQDQRQRLITHCTGFEDFRFPPCHLVWAGHSLPFCPPAAWPALWARIRNALRPGGRFAGDFFGDRHAFAAYDDVMLFTEAEVRRCLQGLTVEAFDIEDGWRPSGGQVTRWHAFGVIARQPEAPGEA